MLKNTILGISTLAITGTIIASTFNGSDTLDNAKNHLQDLSNTLNIFKSNESKLVNAISQLKTTKAELESQIATLQQDNNSKQNTIDELNIQVQNLNNRIEELEQIIADGGNNNEELQQENDRLTNELVKANLEIDKANQLVGQLQVELNASKQVLENNKPLTESQLNEVIGTTTPPTPPTEGEGQTPPPTPPTVTYDYIIDTTNDNYELQDLNIMIMGTTWIFEGTAQYPIIVFYSDGTQQNISPNSTVELNKSIDRIEYKTSSNVLKKIDVNR